MKFLREIFFDDFCLKLEIFPNFTSNIKQKSVNSPLPPGYIFMEVGAYNYKESVYSCLSSLCFLSFTSRLQSTGEYKLVHAFVIPEEVNRFASAL